MNLSEVKTLIAQAFPELPIRTLNYLGAGWANIAYELNAEFVFRFPIKPAAVRDLQKEIALLPELSRRLTLPIPTMQFVPPPNIASDASPAPPAFAGYHKIVGEPLTSELFRRVNGARFAPQLAQFISELQAFPKERAVVLGVPYHTPADWQEKYHVFFSNVQYAVFPFLSAHARATWTERFTDFLIKTQHFNFVPVLSHQDLSAEHILYDAVRDTLGGVIDFEDCVIGDPAFDYCGLLTYGREFMLQVIGLTHSALMCDETALTRIQFYASISPFHEVIWGQETGAEAFTKQAIARLNEV